MKFRLWQAVLAALVLMLPVGMTGCGAFFVCAKASCTTGGSTNTSLTGAYAFVTNSSSSSTAINGYALSSGTLVIGTGFPYTLTYTPTAMAVSTSNKFLFVGSSTTLSSGGVSAIYGYTIGAGGALTAISSTALASANVAALDVSPDGQWLMVLSSGDGQTAATTVTVFAINSSTGALSLGSSQAATSATGLANSPSAIKVAPSGQYVAVALGAGGAVVFPFTTSNGALGIGTPFTAKNSAGASVGIFDVAVDSSNYLYVATAGSVRSLAVSSLGIPASAYFSTVATSSTAPYAVAVDGTSFVYGAAMSSATVSTIYGLSNTSGTLAALTPASVTGPVTTTKMAMDSTNKYLLAAGYSSSGLQMFSVSSTGALTLTSNAATGTTTTVPSFLAMTH